MKYLKTFKENIQLSLFDDFENEKVFENKEWMIIKPKSFQTLLDLSEGTEWRISNIYSNYYAGAFTPTKYQMNDDIYVNLNKNGDKYLFDFNKSDFIDKEDNNVYLKDFFDDNKDLLNYYGEIIYCYNIVKDGNDYWIVNDIGNEWFEDYYKENRDLRNNFIKKILSGDSYDLFEYFGDVDLDEYGIELDDDSLILMKVILLLYKDSNNKKYDYDITEVDDYDDVKDIVKEYKLKELKRLLIRSITTGKESADESAAFDDVTDAFYDFFNLVDGSAKWQIYNRSKSNNQHLWIKFKSKEDAYYAKFRILNPDDSYSDDLIDYSPPYYGYSGDDKVKNEVFNSELFERTSEEIEKFDDIDDYYNLWKDTKKNDPDMSEEEIIERIKLRMQTNKYNI